jgi:hypothetical protein
VHALITSQRRSDRGADKRLPPISTSQRRKEVFDTLVLVATKNY